MTPHFFDGTGPPRVPVIDSPYFDIQAPISFRRSTNSGWIFPLGNGPTLSRKLALCPADSTRKRMRRSAFLKPLSNLLYPQLLAIVLQASNGSSLTFESVLKPAVLAPGRSFSN